MIPLEAPFLSDFAGLRTLVVEDQYLIASYVCRLLRRLGCEPVGPVPCLATAFVALERETPDCALLDVKLGAEQVYPLAEVLRREGVPFLFVTGYDQRKIAASFQAEMRLEKPFDLQDLDMALTRVVPRLLTRDGLARDVMAHGA